MCCELVNVGKCVDTGIALVEKKCSFFVHYLYFLSKIRIQARTRNLNQTDDKNNRFSFKLSLNTFP